MPKERKSTVLLQHHLKQLKLPTMLKEYPLLAKSCSQEKCDYPTYLLRLCEKELADRQRRAMDRRIKAAKFPLLKTIDSFGFASQRSVNEPLVKRRRINDFRTIVPSIPGVIDRIVIACLVGILNRN